VPYSMWNILLGICAIIKRIFVRKSKDEKPDLDQIGRRIRSLRGELLQEDFAHDLGISQGQLSKIESGKLPPTVEILIRLTKRFRKSADWILLGDKQGFSVQREEK